MNKMQIMRLSKEGKSKNDLRELKLQFLEILSKHKNFNTKGMTVSMSFKMCLAKFI